MKQARKAELVLLGSMAVILGLSIAAPVFAWTSTMTTTIQCYNSTSGTWSTCPTGTIAAGTTIRDSAALTLTEESNCGPGYTTNCGTISFYVVSGTPSTSCKNGVTGSGTAPSAPSGATAEGSSTVPTSADSGTPGTYYSSSPSLSAGTYYWYVSYSGTGSSGYPYYYICEPFTGGAFPPPPPPSVPQFPLGLAALMAVAIPALLLVKSRRSAIRVN